MANIMGEDMTSFDKSLAIVAFFVMITLLGAVVGGLQCARESNTKDIIEHGQRSSLIQTCLQQGNKPLDCTNALNRSYNGI